MKVLVRVTVGLVVALLAAAVGLLLISEFGGEVVVLHTSDASGDAHETRLWVVDWDGEPWLRAGGEDVSWFEHLRENAECTLVRGGREERYRAVPYRDEATRDRVSALMAADYGFANSVILLIRDESFSIPIRLEMLE